jgi:transposase
MLIELLLPSDGNLELHEVTVEDDVITLTASSRWPVAMCPDCHQPSSREHSRYWRAPADLPCVGRQMRLDLFVRRFFCDNPLCDRKTFAERFPDLVAPYARRTNRLSIKQQRIGLALGGEPGADTLTEMAMPVSGDTVLRLIRKTPQENVPTPHILGIDDWAWCKGQRYGTILVDLERRRSIDLLPDRSADAVAAWLRTHPGIQIISYDRGRDYIKGIRRGAPNAAQVADRWHLLRNLKDALIRILERNRACLYAAAAESEDDPEPHPTPETSAPLETADRPPLTKAEQVRQVSYERRLARYEAVRELHKQGTRVRAIARQLSMSRDTVRRYLQADQCPETACRKRHSILSPYFPYLRKRWAEGCHNGLQLYREIREQGYSGSRPLVSRWAAQVRKKEPKSVSSRKTLTKPESRVRRPWSAPYAVWLLLKPPETLSSKKQAALHRMLRASPVLGRVYNFAQAFIRIVRCRLSKALRPWLSAVTKNKIPELSNLARSLERDQSAVLAALSLPWSNGQVEGQVNRLKRIKRQMFGRAKFDLLRLRVLAHSGP